MEIFGIREPISVFFHLFPLLLSSSFFQFKLSVLNRKKHQQRNPAFNDEHKSAEKFYAFLTLFQKPSTSDCIFVSTNYGLYVRSFYPSIQRVTRELFTHCPFKSKVPKSNTLAYKTKKKSGEEHKMHQRILIKC